ncbi:hypothetical protein IWX76_001520 [Pedobacter sp. CAN_A7]|uniref:hypothetical protein n=1 Tax=Pedobacter sp. CAN_A7 TaxID=2787722 RepID=UPI0018CB9A27
MLRRSLFSMLLGNSEGTAVTQETVTGIDMPAYLKTENIMPLVKEFDEIISGQEFELKVSTAHAFKISWSSTSDTLITSHLLLGTKAAAANVKVPIELGLHADGYLFIGGIKDKRVLSLEKGSQHFQLEVHPQGENSTYAKLTLRDHYGLTLATVKNSDYSTEDWSGNLLNMGQNLMHLKIEGSILK